MRRITSNSKHNGQKTQNTKRREASFIKEQVENTDSSKSVLNKIMTTFE